MQSEMPRVADASTRRTYVTLALLVLVSFFNYMDRMILPAVAQPIKLEFGLSDTELGLLNGLVFVLLYGISGLPLSRWADRTSRTRVLAAALAFWSLATAACGMARTFSQLVVARMCVGIGESASQPVGFSIVGELFPVQRRARAMGWFLMGNNLGITAGFALGGWLAARYGWRSAFLAVALPGVVVAAALALVRNPRVVVADGGAKRPLSLFADVRGLLRNRRYCWLLVLSGTYGFTIFGPVSWLTAFFIRSHQLPLSAAAAAAGLVIGLGMTCGTLFGGAAADRLALGGGHRPQWLGLGSILLSGLAFATTFTVANVSLAFAAAFFATLFGSVASPAITTAIQNESPPALRATAASLATITVSILGIALAPFLVGVLSDQLTPAYGKESLRIALLISLGGCLFAAALHYRVATLFKTDNAV